MRTDTDLVTVGTGVGGGKVLTIKEEQRNFPRSVAILYLDCSDGYKTRTFVKTHRTIDYIMAAFIVNKL